MHACPSCKYRFETAEDLRRHLEDGGCPEWADGPNGTRVAMIGGQVHIHTVEAKHHDGCPR